MSIKVNIPANVSELTVHGLHQWDYGRTLEIRSDELPALVEVHFACAGMKDAVVRSCSVIDGVVTAVIPDICLEQTSPVYAWIYIVSDTAGATVKTITLPIVARTRPQLDASIPRDTSDAYTQFIAEVNALVESLKEGTAVVSRALTADHATEADHASSADSVGMAIVSTIEDINALVAERKSCPVGFSKSITIGGVEFPAHAKGFLTTSNDATIYVIATDGKVYTAFRDNGTWKGGRVSTAAETAKKADEATTATRAGYLHQAKITVSGNAAAISTSGLYAVVVNTTAISGVGIERRTTLIQIVKSVECRAGVGTGAEVYYDPTNGLLSAASGTLVSVYFLGQPAE